MRLDLCWLAALLVVGGCIFDDGGEPERQVVVEADDGSATLRIPPHALPDGFDASTITLVRDDGAVSSDDGIVRAWTLEPDGLMLLAPAELTLRADRDDVGLVVVDHHSGESLVERLVTTLNLDADGRLESTVVMVEHFSEIVFMNARSNGMFEWEREPRDLVFGETMTVSVDVTIPELFATYMYDGRSTTVFDTDPVMWDDVTEVEASAVLRPTLRTHEEEHLVTPSVNVPADFTCESPGGEYSLEARTRVSIAVEGIITLPDGRELPVVLKDGMRAQGRGVLESAEYRCAAGLDCSPPEKEEYTTARAELGEDRIETLTTSDSTSTDLSATDGSFGYYVTLMPGQTITVTVTAGAAVSLEFFPHRPPGFEYTDTTPGTTQIRNVSADCSNSVLLVADGSTTVNVSISTD